MGVNFIAAKKRSKTGSIGNSAKNAKTPPKTPAPLPNSMRRTKSQRPASVTAKKSSRVHPRCGTNILGYIVLAALFDPLIDWWGYAVLQFIFISEAWFVLGKTRPSIAVGDFLQRYFTTTEPRPAELEVAVESLNKLLRAEEERAAGGELAKAPVRS